MTVLIQQRIGGVMHTCDSACYDAKSSADECECVCGGTNHGKGVSGLFGSDVLRKDQYLDLRLQAFLAELVRKSLSSSGMVYGGLRVDPSQRYPSVVQVYAAQGNTYKQILHRCRTSAKLRYCRAMGFDWGHGGDRTSELARYIAASALGQYYFTAPAATEDFKREFLVHAGDVWFITRDQIEAWRTDRRREASRRAS